MWFLVNIWSNFQLILSSSHIIFTKTHFHSQKGMVYHKYTSNQQITAVVFIICEKNVPTSSWDPALVTLGYQWEFTKSSLILGYFISSVQKPYTGLSFYLKNRFNGHKQRIVIFLCGRICGYNRTFCKKNRFLSILGQIFNLFCHWATIFSQKRIFTTKKVWYIINRHLTNK